MKLRFIPATVADGKPRNTTRRFLNECVQSDGLMSVNLTRSRDTGGELFHGEVKLGGGSCFQVTEATPDEARVLTTGAFKGAVGGPVRTTEIEVEEDPAADL